MRPVHTAIAAVATAFALVLSTVAAASAAPETEIDAAIFTETELQLGISLTAARLDELQVDASKIDAYMLGEAPADNVDPEGTGPDPGPYPDPEFENGQSSAAAYPIYQILHRWSDRYGATNIIRRGYYNSADDKGFGNDKFYWKHNLTAGAVKATTRYGTRTFVSGSKYNYHIKVWRVKCSGWGPWRKCKVVEEKTVRVAHDFRKLTDGSPFGVVTAFCLGVVKCPDWVKNAINI